jgi:hypothetical protein
MTSSLLETPRATSNSGISGVSNQKLINQIMKKSYGPPTELKLFGSSRLTKIVLTL